MNRLVVSNLPHHAVRVHPSDTRPVVVTKEVKYTLVDGMMEPKTTVTESPWQLNSDVARLIGEARSLPRGRILKLVDMHYISLNLRNIAWFAERARVALLVADRQHYLKRSA